MGRLRFLCALWAAKLSIPALKLTRHNGTNFPGELALKICPDFLRYIGKPARIIAVTGTNGKTTVSNLLCDSLEQLGVRLLNNRAGSNINSGISTSLITGADLLGRAKYDTAVFEVDERSALRIYPYVRPELIVMTNLFRDSIMRNGHPGFIADILTKGMPTESKLVLNADDLICSGVAPDNARVYYGLRRMDGDLTECVNLINDMRICPKCGGRLRYEYLRYHHIGRAMCADCGFASPEYDYAGEDVDLSAMTMTAAHGGERCTLPLISDSVFNVYNMMAVIAALCEFGIPLAKAAEAAGKTKVVGTRHSEVHAGDIDIVMQMAKEKNALAITRAFDYAVTKPGRKELLLMMNCLSDEKHWSENTCWLYDCDFEFLARDDVSRVIATGPRAMDYRLRLLLAGVPEEKIVCERDELRAADMLELVPGETVYIFHGVDSFDLTVRVRERIRERIEEAAK